MKDIRSYRRLDYMLEAKDESAKHDGKTDGKTEDSKDEKKENDEQSLISKLGKMITDAVNNFAADKAGDLIDELMLGNFKDALIDVFKDKAKTELDEKKIQAAIEDLKNNPQYKKAADYAKLDSRKDDNTNSEVDASTVKKFIMWHSKDKEADLGAAINEVVAQFQKQATEIEKQQKALASKLKSMKVKLSDEEFAQIGPMLAKDIDEGADAATIQKKVDELKKKLHESYLRHTSRFINESFKTESVILLTEEQKNQLMLESIIDMDEFAEAAAYSMLNEGMFSSIKSGFKAVKDKLADAGKSALTSLTKGAITPMLSLVGIGFGIVTGGWAATAIVKLMYIIEKQGKKLRNGFEKAYTKYANSKGAIASMSFSIKDDADKKYAMRFYEKDLVWRVINTADQLKHPGIDFSKAVVDGDAGKKFRDEIAKVWDPLFSQAKGGKIDFKAVFSQAKDAKIPEKYLDAFQKFADNYDKIKANCIDSPKIDTRTQSLKKNKDV